MAASFPPASLRQVSLYDPVFSGAERDDSDLDEARSLFARAGRPYLRSPWPWVMWAVALPVGALATPAVGARWGLVGGLLLWTVVILVGGSGELWAMSRGASGARTRTSRSAER